MPALACNGPPPPPSTYSSDAAQSENPWSPAHSSLLYRVEGWGAPYFAVNSNGNVSVLPHGIHTSPHHEIDLLKVVKMATDPKSSGGLGLDLPLLVRFPDVLKNRLESLQMAFDAAIETHSYNSRYRGVYPIKCNQDRFVVEDIVRFGKGFGFGLEAGSKPELLLAMSSLCNGSAEALLVCNGFKDVEYISLALIAKKLQLNSVIVLEQEEEADIVIEVSKKLGVRPTIGLRAKLRTKHSGHFGSTSGEKGKFGLTTTQILRVVKKLAQHDVLDCLQLLHFHIGSQIPSTTLLADGIGEAAQIYCELVRLGAHMGILDVGGGLGLDYDGTKSQDSDISVSYTLQEYAAAVVKAVKFVCDRNGVDHPLICSESGRAVVSHHSVLVFEAFSSSRHHCSFPNGAADDNGLMMVPSFGIQSLVEALGEDALSEYRSLSSAVIRGDYDSCLVHVERLKQRCVEQFKEGSLGMEQLASADGLYELIMKSTGAYDSVSTYHVNLSIFTSIPDFWAIGQIFPIIPIHRLDEKPSVRAVLSDLTCDSDGKIDRFIDGESSLPVHELKDGFGSKILSEPYYMGMFLGGAYQESLGGLHNLFSGPSVVRAVRTDGPLGFAVERAVPGPSCGDVLRVMGHEPEVMFEALKRRVGKFVGDEVMVVDGLACSFGNMPYLLGVGSGSGLGPCGVMAGLYGGGEDNGYCYCSDECYASSSSGDSVVTDDDQWSYCAA